MEGPSTGPPRGPSLTDQIEHIKELISLSYTGANEGFSHQIYRRSRGLTTGQSQILQELDSLKRSYRQQQARRDSATDDSDELPSAGGEDVEPRQWADEDNFQKELADIKRRHEEALEFAEERIDHLDDERGELSKSVHDLRSQLEQSQHEQEGLSEATEHTRAELQQLRLEKSEALDALNDTKQRVGELNALLAEAKDKNRDLQSLVERYQQIEQSVRELKASLSSQRQEAEQLKGDLLSSKNDQKRLSTDLENSQREAVSKGHDLGELASTHADLEERNRELETQLSNSRQEAKHHEDALSLAATQREEELSQIQKSMALVETKDGEIRDLKERIREAQKVSQGFEHSLSKRNLEVHALQEDLQKVRAEHSSKAASQEESLRVTSEALGKSRKDTEGALKEAERLQNEIEGKRISYAEKEKEAANLREESRLAHLEYSKQTDALAGNLRELEKQLSTKEREAQIARDALEGVRTTYVKQCYNLEDSLKEVRSSLATKDQESQDSNRALQAANDELQSLRKDLDRVKANHDQLLSNHTDSEENWRKFEKETHDEHEKQLAQLQQTCEEQLQNWQAEAQSKSSKISDLETALAKAEEDHRATETRFDTQISELKAKHESEAQTMRRDLTEMEQSRVEMKEGLHDTQSQLGELQGSLQTHQHEVHSLQDQLKEERLKSGGLHDTYDREITAHASAKAQLEEVQGALRASQSDLDDARKQLEDWQLKYADLSKSHTETKQEHGEIKIQLEALQNSSDQLRQLHEDQFRQAIEDLATERSKRAEAEKAAQGTPQQLEEAHGRLRSFEESAKDSQQRLEQRIEGLLIELEEKQSNILEQQGTCEKALQDLAVEHEKVVKAEDVNRTQSERLQTSQSQLKELELSTSKSRQDLESCIERLKIEAETSHLQTTESEQEHERVVAILSKERTRATEAEGALQATSQLLQETQNSHQDLQRTSDQSRQSLECHVQDLERELKENRSKTSEADLAHQRKTAEVEQEHEQRLASVDQELAEAMSKLVGLEATLEESRHSADVKNQEHLTRLNEETSKFQQAQQIHTEQVRALEHERNESLRQIADLQTSHGNVKKELDLRITQLEKNLEMEKSSFQNAEQAYIRQTASMEEAWKNSLGAPQRLQTVIEDLQQSFRQDSERNSKAAEEERSKASSVERDLRQRLNNLEQSHAASLEKAREDLVSSRKQLTEAKEAHWKRIQDMGVKHDFEIEELRTSLGAAQKKLREADFSHRYELKDLEDHLAFKLADAESTKRAELREVEARYQQQTKDQERLAKEAESRWTEARNEAEKAWKHDDQEARSTHKREMEEVIAQHAKQLRGVEETFQANIEALENRLISEKAEAESRNRKKSEEAALNHGAAMKAMQESHISELSRAQDRYERLAKEAEVTQRSEFTNLEGRMTAKIVELEANLTKAEAGHRAALAETQEKHLQQMQEAEERYKSDIAELEVDRAKEVADLETRRSLELAESNAAHERAVQGLQETTDGELSAAEEHHRQVLNEALGTEKQLFETKLTDLQASHRAALAEVVAEAQSKSESTLAAQSTQHNLDLDRLRKLHSADLDALQDKVQEAVETSKRTIDEKATLLSEMASLRQQLDDSLLEAERKGGQESSTNEEIEVLKQRLEQASTYQASFTTRMDEEMQRALASVRSAEEERDTLAAQLASLRLQIGSSTIGDNLAEDTLRKKLMNAKKRESRYFKEQDFLKAQIRTLQQQLQQAQDQLERSDRRPKNAIRTTSAAQPSNKVAPIASRLKEENAELSQQNEQLREQLSDLRLELVRTRAAGNTKRTPSKPAQPEVSRQATLKALEGEPRPEKAAKQKAQYSKKREASPRSFDDYLRRAEVELSDLGKAISANESLFAQKIREHVDDLQKAKDQLSQEYKTKYERILQERTKLEQKLASKQAEDLAEARSKLIAQYTNDPDVTKGDERMARIESLTPQRKQALKEADAELVAEHDHKLATRRSQLELKHEADVQNLGEQFEAKIAQILKDRANLEADLSISPDEFEQLSRTLELEVERMHIGSRSTEADTPSAAEVGTAEAVLFTPNRTRSPEQSESAVRARRTDSAAITPPFMSSRAFSSVQNPKEKYRMVDEPEPSRSFSTSAIPLQNRPADGKKEKAFVAQPVPPNVLPIPHRIAAARAVPPTHSSSKSQAESPSTAEYSPTPRPAFTSPHSLNRRITSSPAKETSPINFRRNTRRT
ncbi:MAG: hypothetical protein M1822_005822 [Bathelium mastoideum]|nr:MAG: hypothetical protein M1822_005822 [Bathelium mastoideum]